MTRYTRAARAFEDFTGRKPKKVTRYPRLDDSDVVGWEMGPAVGVAYEAVRDGEKAQYFHEFAKSARPTLVSREDGKQLYLSGGKYTVTERGIEDMPELFVVNPSSRRGAATKRKAMAKAQRNSKGRFVKAGRGRATTKRRRSATRQVAVFSANPAPRKRRRSRTAVAAPKRRRFRRNPSGGGLHMKGLGQLIVPAAGVGAGAVVAEVVMGYLPIPANWKTGVLRQVSKGAVGLALGWGVAHLLRQKKLGFYIMAGAVVIAVHDGIKEFLTAKAPTMTAGAAFGQYVKPLPSQFAGRRAAGMGYINPARTQRMGQYVQPLRRQFAGDTPMFAHPGGETNYVY